MEKGRRSDNVVDARGDDVGGGGMRFGGGKGLSLTAILLIVGIGWITGQDPLQILGQLTGQMTSKRHRRPLKRARRHQPVMKRRIRPFDSG
jgi:predicted metalloprotease